jgi:uncharacterized protein YhfF
MRAHAVLLDVTHRLLAIDGAPFAVDVPAGQRPLHALEVAAQARLGRELPVALGRHIAGDDAWFAFVDDTLTDKTLSGGELVPLRTWAARYAAPWTLYVEGVLGGWRPPTTDLVVFFFGNEPRLASQLAHCVIKGTKRATTGWVALAEHEGWAGLQIGLVSIVTDGFGIPLCAIETTRIERARFRDAGPEIAAAEGEGDLSFDDWRAAHLRYFGREAARTGIPFTDDSELDYEYFKVLHVFQRM